MVRKRVAYVGPALALSGSTMVMLDVLNHLDRAKYEPHLILTPGASMTAAHLLREDVVIHDARRLRDWWSRGALQDYRFARYIDRLIETDCPDVFIADHRKYNYFFSQFKKRYGVKVINRVGTVVSWRLKQTRRECEYDMMRRLLPYSDAIIVPSALVKRDLAEAFQIEPSQIRVIHNALDVDKVRKYGAEELNYQSNAGVLLYVGTLDEGKTPMLLLEAFRELRVQGKKLELWLVGNGDERRRLGQYATRNGLGDSVKFWGWQKNPYKFLKRADVFLHASQMDGFGIALIEAAYFNLPIVYADTLVGAKELLKKHGIGHPFDIDSKTELVEKINVALKQPKATYFPLLEQDVSIRTFIQQMERVIDEATVDGGNG